MKDADRKAAIARYRERKSRPGLYAFRRADTGQVWIGAAPNVDAIENRVRFQLGAGRCPSASLQAAWKTCGDAGLSFEIVEALPDDLSDYVRDARLKERRAQLAAGLGAEAI